MDLEEEFLLGMERHFEIRSCLCSKYCYYSREYDLIFAEDKDGGNLIEKLLLKAISNSDFHFIQDLQYELPYLNTYELVDASINKVLSCELKELNKTARFATMVVKRCTYTEPSRCVVQLLHSPYERHTKLINLLDELVIIATRTPNMFNALVRDICHFLDHHRCEVEAYKTERFLAHQFAGIFDTCRILDRIESVRASIQERKAKSKLQIKKANKLRKSAFINRNLKPILIKL